MSKSSGGKGWFKKSYWGFVKSEHFIGHFFLLAIRLYWGALLVLAGSGKWMNLQHVGEYFNRLQIPNPQIMAYVVATVELLGGISLIFGLLSRFFSLLLTIVFFTAFFTAHREALTSLKAVIDQEPFLYLFTSLAVLSFGPGLFSVDYWLEKKWYGQPIYS